MGPNIKGSLTAAISAAAGPAVEVAKSLSIQSSSIANADQIPPSKEVLDDFKDIQIKSENEIASVIRKISSQKQAWGTESTGLAVDPCIDVVEDVDIEKEEFIPHFQRVSVSGDDNTGVSILYSYLRSDVKVLGSNFSLYIMKNVVGNIQVSHFKCLS